MKIRRRVLNRGEQKMKFFKGKKGKKYPEMVDTIHGDSMEEDFADESREMPEEGQENDRSLTAGNGSNMPGSETDSKGSGPDPSYEKTSDKRSEKDRMLAEQENQPVDSFLSYDEGYESPQEEQDGIEEEFISERDLARKARMKRRKREMRRVRFLICFLVLLLFAGVGTAGYLILHGRGTESSLSSSGGFLSGKSSKENDVVTKEGAGQTPDDNKDLSGNAQTDKSSVQKEEKPTEKVTEASGTLVSAAVTAEADRMAAQYDYDGAINLLKAQQEYGADSAAQQKVSDYEAAKAACVEISPDTVSHVFVHSLIVDPTRAFDGQDNQQGYNLNMVTLEEFKKIIQSMYDNGYVLVSLHDMGEIDANGQMQRKSIYLPEGKKPIIFSQDDVSYYHSYANDGFADRLIVDENGDVKNEYTDAAGNTTVGDYDMVPVLDTFIKEHPDFSYRGRKGIVVLTGYNGVLGYHTDGDYRDKLSLQADQAKWLEEHPEFDFDADVAAATKVADAMKANGWEFASHTWGHISVSDVSLDKLQTDTQKWLDYVAPIVGNTDMIIFAFGSDIGDWTGYASDNEKFNYLKSVGFDYFCNVDGSSLSWVQFGETYLRTGRMNIDGYRMSSNPDVLAPLFDVSQVYDYDNRPEMAAWSQ